VRIHPTAVVSPLARLGPGVIVHPFCVIEADVTIGEGCVLHNGVVVKSGTTLGQHNQVFDGAVLGGLPQHAHMPEHPGRLVIGDRNTLREHVTIHRAMHAGSATTLGDHNLLMVNVHIAHDCQVANHTIMANNAMLAGHVTIADRAYLSGAVGIHQFCRVGSYAMVGGQARVVKDIPPYVTIDGATTLVVGLNQVGLRRNGFGLSPDLPQRIEMVRNPRAAGGRVSKRPGIAVPGVLPRRPSGLYARTPHARHHQAQRPGLAGRSGRSRRGSHWSFAIGYSPLTNDQ
jgi:UDP-N-acetylglucosamine acyltransferase